MSDTTCAVCGSIVPPGRAGKVHNIGNDGSRWCNGRPPPTIEPGNLYRLIPELAEGSKWRGVVMVAVRRSLGDGWRFASKRGGAWLPPQHVEEAKGVRAATRRLLAARYEELSAAERDIADAIDGRNRWTFDLHAAGASVISARTPTVVVGGSRESPKITFEMDVPEALARRLLREGCAVEIDPDAPAAPAPPGNSRG